MRSVALAGVLATCSLVARPLLAMHVTQVGPLAVARRDAALVDLGNGSVLICGGHDGSRATGSCERFDPQGRTWQSAASLRTPRAGHSLTVLGDGRVVAVGGTGNSGLIEQAEVRDPVTGTWAASGALAQARRAHTALRLDNGWVLVSGGLDSSGEPLASTELWNPSSGQFVATGDLGEARQGHALALLPDRTVIAVAGRGRGGALASIERLLLASGVWEPHGALLRARADFAMTALGSDRHHVSGGVDAAGQVLAEAEIYSTALHSSQATAAMRAARHGHSAHALAGDLVWVAGGLAPDGTVRRSTEVFNPTLDTWFSTGLLGAARARHLVAPLSHSALVLAGGEAQDGPVATTELFHTGVGDWLPVATPATPHAFGYGCRMGSGILLDDGRALLAGAIQNCSGPVLFDPRDQSWDPLPNFTEIYLPTFLAQLADGRVLALGVDLLANSEQRGEILDLAARTWTAIARPDELVRNGHSSTLLPGDQVLVAGGEHWGVLAQCEAYDVRFDTWWPAGTMRVPRHAHGALLLDSGRVLALGGIDGSGVRTRSCEWYTPSSGAWALRAELPVAVHSPSAVLLAPGVVLASGGNGTTSAYLTSAYLYAVADDSWRRTGDMAIPKRGHSLHRLPGGAVLATGGYRGSFDLNTSAEVYDPATEAWWPAGRIAAVSPSVQLGDGSVLVGPEEDAAGLLHAVRYVEGAFPAGAGCDVDADCPPPQVCSAEGVCCDQRCDGICESCVLAPRVGTCSAVPAGADPHQQCGGDPICAGVCSGLRSCLFPAAQEPCDDGAPCTSADVCDGRGACRGTPYQCAPGVCEQDAVCDGLGGCQPVLQAPGTPCDDGEICSFDDRCSAAGLCLGLAYTCAPAPCELTSSCDGRGSCQPVLQVPGTPCDDGDPCTRLDACDALGRCLGVADPACAGVDAGVAPRDAADLPDQPRDATPSEAGSDRPLPVDARPGEAGTDAAGADAPGADTPATDVSWPLDGAPGDAGGARDADQAERAPGDEAARPDTSTLERLATDGAAPAEGGAVESGAAEGGEPVDGSPVIADARARPDAHGAQVHVATGGCACGATGSPRHRGPPPPVLAALAVTLALGGQRRRRARR